MDTQRLTNPRYELLILSLSLFAIGILSLETFASLGTESSSILQFADTAVCVVFMFDFLRSLYRAESKMKYLSTWGWLDFLSSIPVLDPLRWGRAARVIRVIRVLRTLRATRMLARAILSRRAEGAFLATLLISFLLVIFSSVAILQFEKSDAANIKNAEDALWWSWATITTVGYGDKFPVSTEGRLVAVLLMTAGVGMFGTLSGFIASWFLSPENEEQDEEIRLMRLELKSISEKLDQLRSHQDEIVRPTK